MKSLFYEKNNLRETPSEKEVATSVSKRQPIVEEEAAAAGRSANASASDAICARDTLLADVAARPLRRFPQTHRRTREDSRWTHQITSCQRAAREKDLSCCFPQESPRPLSIIVSASVW